MLRVWTAVLALAASVACASPGQQAASPERRAASACKEQPLPSGTRPPGATQCLMDAQLKTRVAGAVTFSDDAQRKLGIVEFHGEKLPKVTWFASLAMTLPADYADKAKYRATFSIAPGTYRGEGKYTLTTKRPTVEGLSSPLKDDVTVELTSLAPESIGLTKYVLADPCDLTVREKLTRGKLVCPKLHDEEGGKGDISLTMEWRPA